MKTFSDDYQTCGLLGCGLEFTQLSGSTLVSPGGCSSFSFLKMDGTPFQTHEHQEKCLGGSIMIEHSEDVFR